MNDAQGTLAVLDATKIGKTALLQGPVASTETSVMKPVWEQPDNLTFSKKHGFVYNMRLDFMYDPTNYETSHLHNVSVFIVKIVNFARASTTQQGTPALRPGTPGWNYQESFLDQSGDIHGAHLIRDVHYTSGALNNGTVTLSPKYFNVLHKFNLAANHRSVNLGALPGNQTMNWSVNVPLGRMKLEQYGDRQGLDPILPNTYTWEGLNQKMIDPEKQIHMLIFSNSALESSSPFGAANMRPVLSVRKTFTFGTSLT